MSKSPCAMLMMRMTPNVIARPRAVRIKIDPRLRLLESAELKSVILIGACRPIGRGERLAASLCERCQSFRETVNSACESSRPNERFCSARTSSRPNETILRADLDLLAFGDAALGPVAVPAREGNRRIGIGFDQVSGIDHVKLLVVADLAHIEAFVGVLRFGIELHFAAGRVELDAALECLADFIHVGAPGLLDGELPEVHLIVGRLDGIIGDAVLAVFVLEPLDEFLVLRRVDALEVVPGREVSLDLNRVQAAQLVLADAYCDDRNLIGGDALRL